MKLSDFEKLSLNRAQKIKKYVASIRPVLQDLDEEYEGFISSGDLGQMISSRSDDYWFEKPPKTHEANTALAYLAYNEVAITYLDWQSWQHIEKAQTYSEVGNNQQLKFDNFQE